MAKLTSNEKQFLKDLIQPVQPKLRLAWLMTVFSTLIFVAQSWILASIFSHWLNQQFAGEPFDSQILWQWLPWLVLCFVLRPLFQLIRELISSKASLSVRSQLRERLLSALASLGSARSQFGSDGNISSQVIEQTDALDGYISRFSVQKKVTASTPLILLIAVATQSVLASLILFATAPLVPIFMILVGKMTAKKSAEQFTALSQLSGRFLDWVRGMTTLKRLQTTHIAEEDLAFSSEQYRRRTMDVLKIAFLNGAVLEFLSALCIALVAVYLGFGLMGVLPWDKSHVPVPYFGALFILLLTPEFYAPLRQLGMDYHAQANAEGAVQSLLPLLDKAEELDNSKELDTAKEPQADETNDNSEKSNLTSPIIQLDYQTAPTIKLIDLAIYNTIIDKQATEEQAQKQAEKKAKDKKASKGRQAKSNKEQSNKKNIAETETKPITITRTRLAPMSLTIKSGERIGLVGESGVGKSSLLQAVMGFANYQGQILVNDCDHHQLNIDEFREHIGYMAQQVALLPMTIAENLRLANAQATDEELIEALQAVELYDDLIKKLPKGIHTELGERGRGLSGGQQHRLGIAQLLLQHSNLWLLDINKSIG